MRPLLLEGVQRPIPIALDASSTVAAARALARLNELKEGGQGRSPSTPGAMEQPGKPSALFYDPFAARREQQRSEREKLRAARPQWAQGCKGSAVIKIRNDLSVPLHITRYLHLAPAPILLLLFIFSLCPFP